MHCICHRSHRRARALGRAALIVDDRAIDGQAGSIAVAVMVRQWFPALQSPGST